MTNREIYREYLQQLQRIYSANEAAVITDWVFENMAGLHRFDIIKNPVQVAMPQMLAQLNQSLTALLQHKPVQYVLGEAWFYKMKLTINEQVLIPRPETEELVQLVIDNWQTAKESPAFSSVSVPSGDNQPISMLDIGTGSGCIAIAVKKSIQNVNMYALDVSPGALSVAMQNAAGQQAEIKFLELDFLDENSWDSLPVFDVVISNPPYIPLSEKDGLDKNVTAFEPHGALFVPDNRPLLFYEKIAAFGKMHLRCGGEIYVEIHEDFAEEARQLFLQWYAVVQVRNDMFGKPRMLVAAKSGRV